MTAKEITTEQICRARDLRIEKLQKIFKKKPEGIILFTLNTPGSIKDSPLYRNIFNSGLRSLNSAFNVKEINYCIEEINLPESGTGPEAYISVSGSGLSEIKKITSEIEEKHMLGRVFDLDLFNIDLEQIKSGREMRKCFVCDRPAFECARSRRHPLSEVISRIENTAKKYFDSLCWKTASTAARAMMTEVLVTPKPGLVDRANSGVHSDMDIFSFADSTAALVKTFYDMASAAYIYPENFNKAQPADDLSKLLAPLRKIGLEGEKEMFRITEGVNTQKGLIFSIGILSGAAGYLFSNSREIITAELLCLTGKRIVKGITEKDFNIQSGSAAEEKSRSITAAACYQNNDASSAGSISGREESIITTGEKLYRKHGIKGARGEAEGGFRTSLRALAILKSRLEEGWDFNLSLADTLINIIPETEDTNIPGRNSLETLSYAEEKCRTFIKEGGVFSENGIEKLKKLDSDFIEKNISPGGSADILATALFLFFMEEELKY